MWYCDATKENVSIIHACILTVSHMMMQGVINSNQKEIKHTLTRSHTYTFDVHYLCDYLLLCFIQPHSHTTVKVQLVQFSKYRMIHLYTERLRHRKWVTLKGLLAQWFVFCICTGVDAVALSDNTLDNKHCINFNFLFLFFIFLLHFFAIPIFMYILLFLYSI